MLVRLILVFISTQVNAVLSDSLGQNILMCIYGRKIRKRFGKNGVCAMGYTSREYSRGSLVRTLRQANMPPALLDFPLMLISAEKFHTRRELKHTAH